MSKKALIPAIVCLAAAIVVVATVILTGAGDEKSIAPKYSSGDELEPTASVAGATQAQQDYSAEQTITTAYLPSTTLNIGAPTTVSGTAATTAAPEVNGQISKYFTLPQAPAYNPSSIKINLGSKKVMSYRYNEEKNYYYTDDKECWQANFGFNKTYDVLAPLGVMYYQTVRTAFDYADKSWRLQVWKGQYGTMFVGSEVGIYTQDINDTGDHFVCAGKDDWLNMEMTLYWDPYCTGNYAPVLTRPYDQYWWCTGFVAGFEENMMSDHTDLRMIARITFKDTAMANAFCEQFEKNGFKRVSRLGVESLDSFLQVGPDVAFVWQNLGTNN